MAMKKRLVLFAAAAFVIILCGSVYAAGRVAHSLSIDEETAQNFAFVDADILPEDAVVSDTDFDFENGRFVYEIEFSAQGVRYHYVIDAKNGSVISREQEGTRITAAASESANAASSENRQKGAALAPDPVNGSDGSRNRKNAEYIGVQLAKEIALKDAGLTAEAVIFSKAKLESDDGEPCYDLEFYIAGEREYEYEIAAADGRILEKSSEKLTPAQTAVSQPPASDLKAQEQGTQKQETQKHRMQKQETAGDTDQNQQSAAGTGHQNAGVTYADDDDDYDDYNDDDAYDDDYDDDDDDDDSDDD